MVTPVLKKGNPELVENYRPVSCMPAASKLLESIVCEQLTNFFEFKHLLPQNQHGFRAHRSTMTAWADIQLEWARNNADKEITGILLWDLSAAFDTLDATLMCKKLELYGSSKETVSWFSSFLIGRTRRVKISY